MLLLTDVDMLLAFCNFWLYLSIVSVIVILKIQYWPRCRVPNFYSRARPFRHLPYYCGCIGNANVMLSSSPKFVPASPPWKLARSTWYFNTMCKMVSIHITAFCFI